jgi:hypothetical protein
VRFHIPILVCLSAIVHIGVIANSSLTARDSLGFARQAVNLVHPERSDWGTRAGVLRNTQQPPGYPLAILVVDPVVSGLWEAPRPEQILLAAQVASGIAGVLIVMPLYSLARRLLDARVAFAAVAIYSLLPAVARYTSDGLSESCFLLCVVSAMVFGSGSRMTSGAGLLAGIAAGCAYLVRPEGLAVSSAILVVRIIGGWKVSRRETILTSLCFLVGVSIPAVPYMAVIGGITNKPAARELFDAANAPATVQRAILAEFRPTDAAKDAVSQTLWCLRAAGIEFLRATHYALGILGFLSLVVLGRRVLLRDAVWQTLLLYGAIHLAFVLFLAFRHGYVSDRHVLPLVPVACLLAFRLLQEVPSCWTACAVVIAATCVPPLTKSLHENRVGHKHAGRYLRQVLGSRDELYDPFEWESFYSGRTVEGQAKPVSDPAAIYAVLDDAKGDGAHPRLRHMPEAVQVSRDPRSELVFTWPVGATEAEAKVRVYRMGLTPLSPGGRGAGGEGDSNPQPPHP